MKRRPHVAGHRALILNGFRAQRQLSSGVVEGFNGAELGHIEVWPTSFTSLDCGKRSIASSSMLKTYSSPSFRIAAHGGLYHARPVAVRLDPLGPGR